MDERQTCKIRLWLLVPTVLRYNGVVRMGCSKGVQNRLPSIPRDWQRSLRKKLELLLVEQARTHSNHRPRGRWNCSSRSQIFAWSQAKSRFRWLCRQCQCFQAGNWQIIDKNVIYNLNCRFYLKPDGTWGADKVIDIKPKKVSGWVGDYIQGIIFKY